MEKDTCVKLMNFLGNKLLFDKKIGEKKITGDLLETLLRNYLIISTRGKLWWKINVQLV